MRIRLPDRHRRLTALQRFLAVIGLSGMMVVFAVLAVVRLVNFAVDREIADLLVGLGCVALAVGFAWWFRREVSRTNLWKKVAPAVAVAIPLSLAVAVGTSDTTQAACTTPGTHWHWRSSTDKFKSERQWTNCFSNTAGHGSCTSWYNARNYTYYCSPDIAYSCFWKYTGTISRHHSHQCIF